jgi:hypothetical protein
MPFHVGVFHTNAYPSGLVCVSTLTEEETWSSETTLPEILFSVQQWLAHPNFNSPASSEPYHLCMQQGIDAYNARVKNEVLQYSGYVGHHPHALQMLVDGKERLDTDNIVQKAERLGVTRCVKENWTKPPPPMLESVWKNTSIEEECAQACVCSCSAWGQTFWDEKRKIRHLFGSERKID